MEDLLNHVDLSPAVVAQYHQFVALVAEAVTEDTKPEDIPDEQAEKRPDGSLVIFVDLPGGRVEFAVPCGLWHDRRLN